jgi:negative regulator of sigma E activity
MPLRKDQQELVSRFLDGEVTEQEAIEAQKLLEQEDALDMQIAQSVGNLLREDVERATARVNFNFFADRVLANAEAEAPLSIWERMEEFFRERFGVAARFLLPGAVVAAAIAAFFLAQPRTDENTPSGPRNELVITKAENLWMPQVIDDQGTTILWIDDAQE